MSDQNESLENEAQEPVENTPEATPEAQAEVINFDDKPIEERTVIAADAVQSGAGDAFADLEEDTAGGFGDEYTAQQRADMEKMYGDTVNTMDEHAVLNGVVVDLTDREVVVNIGVKSDGLVSRNEFRDLPDLKLGDEVEVYIEQQEDEYGQLILSRRKAKIVRAWEKIETAHTEDEVIEGVVKRRTKGGLIVDIFGIESFLLDHRSMSSQFVTSMFLLVRKWN